MIKNTITDVAEMTRQAKQRGMDLLQGRSYTEHQLREKLKRGLYPEVAIDEAVAYLKSFRYVDDRRYAENYITYYAESRSRGRIEQDLLKKGLPKELIREVYEEELSEELPDETVLIAKLLEKKQYDKDRADYAQRQKMGAFLYRKGFSLDKIEKML